MQDMKLIDIPGTTWAIWVILLSLNETVRTKVGGTYIQA
jgi:hypothetical protein